MGFSTANAKVDCDKRPDHPACADTDDGTVQLGSGDDVWPGAGDDNTGDDVVFGGDGWDEIFGGQGNDDLYGEAGNDYLDGQAGDDRLNGGDGVDDLYGGVGNDQFYVDGSDNGDFADGGEGYDSLYLDFLDTVTVWFENPDDPDSVGVYRGSYYVKRAGTFEVEGYFKNIEFLYGSTLDGIYHGNNLANTIWGREGNDTIYGYGGDDYLRGGGMTLSQTDHIGDYIDGGEGNDRINGMIGDDYIIGGPGHDEIWIHDNGNHDTVEDFEIGDKIVIYNSNICWPDLTVTTVDSGGDENVADTLVAWRVKNKSNSITLLDFPLSQLSKDDFVFEVEGEIPTYSGCP
jgi:Ca2+-binding RTX toxin-like protein